MKRVRLLVDTDIFIDYFNLGLFREVFTGSAEVYCSVVTKKELLGKPGLKDKERQEILRVLKRLRLVSLNQKITEKYAELRRCHPHREKEDCLIAATAICKDLPLLTRNLKHYREFDEIRFYS